ncbi:MAG: YiiX/YebB-like N1pC/P60 family cysteine hydrolase, partial [Patescibacteria group bacterium]
MFKNTQNRSHFCCRYYSRFLGFIFFSLLLFLPAACFAMPPGTLLYRTSNDGKMFGYSADPLLGIEKGIAKHINSGHVAIYIGKEDGVDYIVEALGGGIVKTPAQYFINSAQGEKFLGAKIPRGLNAIQQAKVVDLAKNLALKNLAYDFDFKKQKGPDSGEWTCVGLTEKLYESADISNPNNLGALEYDQNYYAINITPDGYDNTNIVNSEGDCFSENYEFSKIARRTNMIIPAPELVGYDAGLEYQGDRYIFLPYTQFLQESLIDVLVDINLATSFNDEAIRGKTSSSKIALRWSLINNPVSSLKTIAAKVKEVALNLKDKIIGHNETAIVLNNEKPNETATLAKTNNLSSKTVAKKTKTNAKKATMPKTTAVKKNSAASVSVKKAATSRTVAS